MHRKLIVERFRIIADNIQPTTLCGAFQSQRTDNPMPTLFHSLCNLANISGTVSRCGEEMEDCSIVPYIVGCGLKVDSCDVSNKPLTRFESSVRRLRFASIAVCEISRTVMSNP